MLGSWMLRRSPLAAAVPLEGSDTVPGLRTLERLRSSNLLDTGSSARSRGAQAPRPSRRSNYQRFKGPFIEQMSTDDLQKTPKPWKQFLGDGNQGFNLPASVDVLSERTEVRTRRHAALLSHCGGAPPPSNAGVPAGCCRKTSRPTCPTTSAWRAPSSC